jgi:FixJ family two-component response regulator
VPEEVPLIAIVDDDELMRASMKDLMMAVGFAVEAFACAEDFLKSAHISRTACLVADVNMPGMSGPELHRYLKTSENNIPTILVSAYPNDKVRTDALAAGVHCYFTKPLAEDELLACIRSALDKTSGAFSHTTPKT